MTGWRLILFEVLTAYSTGRGCCLGTGCGRQAGADAVDGLDQDWPAGRIRIAEKRTQ